MISRSSDFVEAAVQNSDTMYEPLIAERMFRLDSPPFGIESLQSCPQS